MSRRIEIRTRDQLRELIAKSAKNPKLYERIAARSAQRLSELGAAAFDARVSVEGVPWVGRGKAPITLNRTGALRALALRYLAQRQRVQVTLAGVRYARYQLGRFWFLPKPSQRKPLPEAWYNDLMDLARGEILKHYTGSAS